MILVADSGSTKTNWIATNGKIAHEFRTSGINPQIQSNHEISAIFNDQIIKEDWFSEISHVYFYGAGCSSEEKCENVKQCLKPHFENSVIFVDHDLTAAGRSLFGQSTGIACIIGTGSNSGLYNGKDIEQNIPALGYILGDEGSGAHLGKMLVRDYIYGIISDKYRIEFEKQTGLNKQLIFDKVYKNPSPNVFLASLAGFVCDRKSDEYFYNLIYRSFTEFVNYHILLYEKFNAYDIGVIGSIAYYNQEIFQKILEEKGLKLKKVIKSPIKELTDYHVKLIF
jgi:N-acetylglucosamine kinase-like BadF-type ATPase